MYKFNHNSRMSAVRVVKRAKTDTRVKTEGPVKQYPPCEKWKSLSLIRDPKWNPWPENNSLHVRIPNQKVAFFDFEEATKSSHKYYLQTQNCAYEDWIISCSKITTYWDSYVKVANNFDPDLTDILVETTSILQRSNWSREYPLKRREYLEEEDERVVHIRIMLTKYLNEFSTITETPVHYNTRATLFDYYITGPKKYPHHIRHCVFQNLELWLRNTPLNVFNTEQDYANILRYLKCPRRGFDMIQATQEQTGIKLADFLNAEWERLSQTKLYVMDPITKYDMSKSSEIPQNAGTIAHKFIENKLLGVDALPELHEFEDYSQINNLLAQIDEMGCVFHPENIERTVGLLVYKLCGTMDGLCLNPDGTYSIWDWKRSAVIAKCIQNLTPIKEGSRIYRCDMESISFSNALMKYHIQTAAYRQAEHLNDPTKRITTLAYLGVIHPSLDDYAIIIMDLNARMRPDVKTACKGITRLIVNQEIIEFPPNPTPIEYIHVFLHQRYQHLKQHFKCEANVEPRD